MPDDRPVALGIAVGTLPELDGPDMVELAAATGFDAVGLRLIPEPPPPEVVRRTARALQDTGIRVLDVPPRGSGVLVFVHPDHAARRLPALKRYFLENLIGNPLDTSIAAASLVFGGVLERFPRLNFVLAHSGGYAPWIRGRWRHGAEVQPETKDRGATASFDEYFARFYFDTVIHHTGALQYLIASVGADRVMLGTDYAAPMGDWTTVGVVRDLPDLGDDEKENILGGNVLRLIGESA